jgi:hypothetical protein
MIRIFIKYLQNILKILYLSNIYMMAYNYIQQEVNNLNDINFEKYPPINYYNFNGISFLAKIKENNENVCFLFHGLVKSMGRKKRIIFRGYDYDLDNCDVISISDGLLQKYSNYTIGWYLSTTKFELNNIYNNIIKFIIDRKKYKQIFFSGTSAGAFPALYFSSMFNKIALIANPVIYPHLYTLKEPPTGFDQLLLIVKTEGDNIKYDYLNFLNFYKPKKIILYQNSLDVAIYQDHVLTFIDELKKKNLDNILELKLFQQNIDKNNKINKKGKKIRPHNICFPNNSSLSDIILHEIENL